MLYLILHKVRGQPAYDVAERCEDMGSASDPAPWWIIPTSGHRAYPIMFVPLKEYVDLDFSWTSESDLWKDLPDHYPTLLVAKRPPKLKIDRDIFNQELAKILDDL